MVKLLDDSERDYHAQGLYDDEEPSGTWYHRGECGSRPRLTRLDHWRSVGPCHGTEARVEAGR